MQLVNVCHSYACSLLQYVIITDKRTWWWWW